MKKHILKPERTKVFAPVKRAFTKSKFDGDAFGVFVEDDEGIFETIVELTSIECYMTGFMSKCINPSCLR